MGGVSCPRCGRDNAGGQRFCGACGAELEPPCAACGAPNPADFAFCGRCGARLAAGETPPPVGAEAEERRWTTVVFADLSGFTNLSERTDPEEVRAVVDSCMGLLGDVVKEFGGSVNQVMGDGMLAVFGAPVAHEDDPERAVRAALEMRRRVDEHADAVSGLPLRVGVQSGEVMFAPVGPDERRQQTVLGDVVNTAARLQAAAPPGGVLVGEETWRATGHVVRYQAVTPLNLKGKEAPVAAWLALEVAEQAERALSAAPMVGRTEELEVLRTTWERVVGDRRPHLVTVLGPAGIGKSRLCLEFRRDVEAEGGRILKGRSLPYGESSGYRAFAEVVKQAAGIFESDSAGDARRKLAERMQQLVPTAEAEPVATHLSVLVGLAEAEIVTDRQVLFFSVRRFVEALAAEQPTVLGFEDCHWAEPSLLDLVEFLAARARETPALFVTTARPELFDARPGWGGGLPAYTALPLDALNEADAGALAASLLKGDERETAGRLVEAAGGNPLFIEELATSVTEGVTDPAQRLPNSVKAIIAARLDALPSGERRVVLDAAVVGKTFWRGALVRLGADGGLDAALDSLEARDLIRREPVSRLEGDVEFTFRHMLIPEVAYSTIPKATRRRQHAAVASFAEEAAGHRLGDVATVLAHHWREAGDTDQAVGYLIAAAEQAGRGWAKIEAMGLYGQALELLPENDPRRRTVRVKRAVMATAAMHAAFGDAPDPGGRLR